jgi:hypothetical protein
MALDAWLRNTDRYNPGNAIVTYARNDDPGQLFYIDFAFSMDFDGHWSAGNHQTFQCPPVPPLLVAGCVRNRVEEAARRIADLPNHLVAKIVGRVPSDFLAAEARERLIGWLNWRKRHLVPAWGQWYAGN